MMELTRTDNNRLRRDLSKDAITLALNGEWERAAEVNSALLEMYHNDIEAMNRLGKALMELGRYGEAREVVDRVIQVSPYNSIAKKNLVRLDQLENAPNSGRQGRKSGGAPQLFIEESGKSGTTVLQKTAEGSVIAGIAPGDPVHLVVEKHTINVYTQGDEYLGQVEPKLGRRLVRMMSGGNRYYAAIVGVNERSVSIIIREAYRHPSLQGVCSFPSRNKEENRVYLGNNLLRYLEDSEVEEEGEGDEERVIDEEEVDSEWEE